MSKEKEVKVSKICIVVGGKEITMSLEEAEELRQILNETFGKKEEVIKYIPNPYPIYVERPYRWEWTYPHWTYKYEVGDNGNSVYYITSANSTGTLQE